MSDVHDFRRLPPNLPIPVDDGAADHLPGMELPSLALPSTQGGTLDLAELAAEAFTLVLYVYPRTGVPGEVLPEGWDEIPGARGCTPQNCAFRDHRAQLTVLGADVVGLSAQPLEHQREFAEREHMPFPLLADPGLELAAALRLPTFDAGGMTVYKRITLVARGGAIERVFYPVFPPDRNAADVAAWLGAVS
ncbi:peroxiredoxin [Conexibacter arvalis]|uniref:Peroxiredoxin n=1 Tax=Conexibacter arvalis TaxID=912552 RepID=A0A840II35_9ACTN|nr:peroxiredoxin [Conexibacter arvalis]MBB4663608.1 peroxiredoxin [Conexibacter arvalis]